MKNELIRILVITYNRPAYTELALQRLCETVPANARITIWDNASESETIDVVKKYETRSVVDRVVYNKTNERLNRPTNWFWDNSRDAVYLSKVDDDCLMPKRWCETLATAHTDIKEAGILGCWRFLPEDFSPTVASRKIQDYGGHMIMRNCWIEGSGYLMKRRVVERVGGIRKGETFTDFCLRAAAKGYINGWYYPFLFQEHMDDPRVEHTGMKTEADFKRLIPLSAEKFGIKTRDEWIERLKLSARRLQEYSTDPYDFIGIKAKLKRKAFNLLGKQYFPKAGQRG